MVAADPAGCLDVFCGGLWLTLDDHQPKARDIETNRNHVGCERDINGFGISPEYGLRTAKGAKDENAIISSE